MSFAGRVRSTLWGISPREAEFSRRGFISSGTAAQARLEAVGGAFVEGYNRALGEPRPAALAERLESGIEAERRGFAYEGAAMGLALADWMWLPRRGKPLARWSQFAAGSGAKHIYMLHVGAGWAAARIPWIRDRLVRQLNRFDPLLGWLLLDGFGFHQGYFYPQAFFVRQKRSRRLSASGSAVFDQGLGRSAWFVHGADVERIGARIAGFEPARHGNLWSGVGLACAYAGGVDRAAIEKLATACGPHLPAVAQGVAFAAEARRKAGNLAPHTEMACEVICGTSAEAAATVTDSCREGLSGEGTIPPYQVWRQRIQSHFQLSLAQRPVVPASVKRTAADGAASTGPAAGVLATESLVS